MKYVILFLFFTTFAQAASSGMDGVDGRPDLAWPTDAVWYTNVVTTYVVTNEVVADSVEDTLNQAERFLDLRCIVASIEQSILAQRIMNERVLSIGKSCGITFEEKQSDKATE